MEENTDGQTSVVKAEPKGGISKEEAEVAGEIIGFHKKALEAASTLAGKMVDYKSQHEDREVRLAIYADKSQKWDKNFDLIKQNNEKMYKLLSDNFKDRRDMIDKGFSIIDKAIADNDMQGALAAFAPLANMVAHSPLAEAAEAAHKLFESGNISQLEEV
jgi:hypothetical protein